MKVERIQKNIKWKLRELLDVCDIDRQNIDDAGVSMLNEIGDALSDFLVELKKLQDAKASEGRRKLGEIFTVRIEKEDSITGLFDLFFDEDAYDTINLRGFLSIWRTDASGKIGDSFRPATVSLYIKLKADTDNGFIDTQLTATKIKNNYCNQIFMADEEEETVFLREIFKPFLQESYDEKGDYFFEQPLKFKAQHDAGKTDTFYIVGANYFMKKI